MRSRLEHVCLQNAYLLFSTQIGLGTRRLDRRFLHLSYHTHIFCREPVIVKLFRFEGHFLLFSLIFLFLIKGTKLSTYKSLGVQFDEEAFPLEGDLPDLGPAEGVNLGDVLEHHDAHVCDRQIQRHAFVVLCSVHFDSCN